METVWRKPLLMLVCKLLIKNVQSFFSLFPSPLPSTSTIHSSSNSNMAGRINDCELITLARINEAPALQATWRLSVREILFSKSRWKISVYSWSEYTFHVMCDRSSLDELRMWIATFRLLTASLLQLFRRWWRGLAGCSQNVNKW